MVTCSDLLRLLASASACVFGVGGCGGDYPADYDERMVESCDTPYRVTNEGVEAQTGLAGQALPQKISVGVYCANTNTAVRDQTVTWTVTAGDGRINGVTTLSASPGSVVWQLGPTLGEQTVRVDYVDTRTGTMNSTTFHATAIEGDVCQTSTPGTPQTPANGERVLAADETWSAASSPHRGSKVRVTAGAILTIKAGTTVCIDRLEFADQGRLMARGTAAEPILFSGSSTTKLWQGLFFMPAAFGVTPADASVLEHALVENPNEVLASHPLSVSDVTFRRTLANAPGYAQLQVGLDDMAPTFLRVVVDGFGAAPDPRSGNSNPAVILATGTLNDLAPPTIEVSLKIVNSPADGMVLYAGGVSPVSVTSCEFSANAGNGLVADGEVRLVTVRGCNFVGNGLAGIRNAENIHLLVATSNWWGDPIGATGPLGDGVAGPVDPSAPLAQPAVLGY